MKRVAISLAVLLAAGCATSDRVTLSAGPKQQALVRDGVPTLVSHKRNTVMLRPVGQLMNSDARPVFVIAMLNRQSGPLDFSVTHIKAESLAAGGKRQALRIFTYEELVAEEQTRQQIEAFAAALSATSRSIQAANAGYSSTYGSYSGHAYGTSTYGTYSSTTYDAGSAMAAQSMASAQTAADFADIEQTGARNMAALQQQILKDNTILPGEWIGGHVVLAPPPKGDDRSADYAVMVSLDGEEHEFLVKQSRQD